MAKQLAIAGTEPERRPELEEIIDALAEIEARMKRDTQSKKRYQALLVSRMMSVELGAYDYVDAHGGKWSALLEAPEASVKLRYLGSVAEDE